jgi:hypothetical protein
METSCKDQYVVDMVLCVSDKLSEKPYYLTFGTKNGLCMVEYDKFHSYHLDNPLSHGFLEFVPLVRLNVQNEIFHYSVF